MGANDKERIEEILEGAAGLDQSHRLEFVNKACNGDPALIEEVCSLLNAGDEGSLREFLDDGLPRIKNSVAWGDAAPQSDSEVQNLRQEEAEEQTRWVGAFVGEEFEGKGKYEILELRRFGLMASLFFGRNRKLGTDVVIKIPRMSAYVEGADDDDRARDAKTNIRNNFRTEFDALRKLEHCNYVVHVSDFGDLPDGRPFMILQLIDGKNGLELLQSDFAGGKGLKAGLAFGEVGNIIRQAGKGLEAAHKLQILHRDMKAENIMVSNDGHVRLIDFNAADVKLPISPMSTVFQHQTWGTLGYTSPEQLKNMLGASEELKPTELTPASDIYSLAVTAYQLLTGKLPFSQNLADLIKEQMACSFSLASNLRPGLDDHVDNVLRTALDYDPSKRPQSAKKFGEDLALALERVGSRRTDTPPIPLPHPSSFSKYAVAALVILLLGAGGYWVWWLRDPTVASNSNANVPAKSDSSTPVSNGAFNASASNSLRAFSYWLDLRRAGNSSSIKASGQEPFTNGDSFALNFVSPQDGYLYLINEGRNYKDVITFYYQGKFKIRANAPVKTTELVFDIKDGIEQFWFLFSNRPVEILEPYQSAGEIPEEKTEQIRAYLKQNVPADLSRDEDMANAKTEVKGSGDPVAYKVDLRHRKAQ
jgi:serine/threonine protein kinase